MVYIFKVPSDKIVSKSPLPQRASKTATSRSLSVTPTSSKIRTISATYSSSSYSSNRFPAKPVPETITTISRLVLQPNLPGEEPPVTKEHFARVLR